LLEAIGKWMETTKVYKINTKEITQDIPDMPSMWGYQLVPGAPNAGSNTSNFWILVSRRTLTNRTITEPVDKCTKFGHHEFAAHLRRVLKEGIHDIKITDITRHIFRLACCVNVNNI